MKQTTFIMLLAIYMLAFNFLVVNAVSSTGMLNNFITGNVVYTSGQPVADAKVLLPLFFFNAAIIALFTLSYHNYKLYHSKAKQHKA